MIRHTKYSAVVTRCIGLLLFCFLYVCLSAQKNTKKPDGIQQKDVVEISPSIGWDPYQQRSGRGFNQNRYRGTGLLYFESEYRRNITSDGLFGFVLFANMNSVAQPSTQKYTYLNGAMGGGIRIKFNKRSGTNMCLDYGISKSYSNFSLNLGETF